MSRHWPIFRDNNTRHSWICAYEKSGDCYTTIGLVEYGEERPVRQMLRYAELGEQIEEIMDSMTGGFLSKDDGLLRIDGAVKSCTKDIMKQENPIKCPEIKHL